ncbi:hypothetical protein Ccrd_019883 [Cynara cardunculus var. scolymus]|uniref:Sodium/sulfate symporter n=1 Tax=Cynara cardunculus var. scolymus TaxID=59895 RepID=A0A103Y3I7_CYNCS|nr:hypothetical protein Ccrd_019883 [Cynara cardunculus var. scolymus]
MEASALFSTAFCPPSLRLRSRLLSKSPPQVFSTTKPTFPPLLRSPQTTTTNPRRLFLTTTTKPSLFTSLSRPVKPVLASSTNENSITESPKSQLQGAKIVPLVLSVAIGLLVRFVVPKPVEVTAQAWQLLAIFVSTIAGLVLSPLPVGAWALLGLTTTIVTKTLTFTTAFSAFTNEVIWLIVISFFFARGFVKTGLGDRIATYFVKWLGKSTLGLSYGLTLSEALIAPAMPSTTARAGGVFLPIIKSLSLSAGSKPNDPSARKLGSYLIQSQFQCAGNSSALFLTAAAQNLLCLKLAEELGLVIASPWVSWFKAASLPAFVSLLLTPYILYKIYPPETKDTPDAPAMAAKRLEAMGPGCYRNSECRYCNVGVIVLVGMAGQLTNLGIVSWMSNCVAKFLQSFSLSWPAAFGVLQGAYFIIHYMFATGYVELPDVFKIGFIMACVNAVIWTVVGGVWWKFLGLY